jgi:hypothetical protein
MSQRIDKKQYEKTLAKLHEIYGGISAAANQVSTWRCPYKNVEDRCTAGFGCRNQDFNVPAGDLYICTGSDKLDYRAAWEV